MTHFFPLRSCLFGLTIIAITFASTAPAQAGGIKFSVVAETSNTPPFFTGFSDFPAINNRGTVAFRASEDFGVFRIYTGPAKGGGPYPDVAETDFTLVVPFDPFINDQGTVAFYAWGTAFSGLTNREILSAPASGAGPVVRIVDNEAGTFSDFSFPGLNSSTIAFLGTFTGGRGLFSVPAGGGALTPVTDTPTGPLATFATPALSSNGVLAFRGRLDTGLTGIFSTSASGSGPITTVADTTEGFSAFGGSIAIANGTAVFQARETSGTTGIYTAPANGTGPVIAIATSAGGFFSDFLNRYSFL